MTLYYRNSKTASLFCIIGCLIGVGGLIALIDTHSASYLLVAAMGFLLLYMGNSVGSRADFNIWLQAQKKEELEKKAKKNLTFAIEKYQECPNQFTYEYIKGLNPEAGTYIQKDRKENHKNFMMGKKN